jgi:putative two-component system response regulator
VADVYDALCSSRAYKPAWDIGNVIEEMRRLRGRKFDPSILDLFLENLAAFAETVV